MEELLAGTEQQQQNLYPVGARHAGNDTELIH